MNINVHAVPGTGDVQGKMDWISCSFWFFHWTENILIEIISEIIRSVLKKIHKISMVVWEWELHHFNMLWILPHFFIDLKVFHLRSMPLWLSSIKYSRRAWVPERSTYNWSWTICIYELSYKSLIWFGALRKCPMLSISCQEKQSSWNG